MNQYRCETCKHKTIAQNYVKEMNGSNWQCKIGTDKRDLTPERQVIISERGCASHSDFQSERGTLYQEIWSDAYADGYNRGCEEREQTIQQNGREKMLDELIDHYEKLIEYGKGVTYNHPITYEWMYRGIVVDYLKELRQGDRG